MIKIESVTTEYENSALWISISLNTNKEIDEYCDFQIKLEGNETYVSNFREKLSIGKNETEIMLYVQDEPWFPNGCGNTYYSELNISISYGEDTDRYRTFIHFGDWEYTDSRLRVYSYYPQIYGVSLQHASIHQLEIVADNGINCIFTNDRREEIKDFCVIKGLCLLPFDIPNCKKDDIELYRKNNKNIILSYSDIDQNFELKKKLSPIFTGKDFITNNTDIYIYGTLSIGHLDPLNNNINIISEEEISVSEFQNHIFPEIPAPKDDEITFANVWSQKNIIAKYIKYGKNVRFSKANVIITRFQINENTWEILFSSNEFIPALKIDTEDHIDMNNFSIFPGETVPVIFSNIKDTPQFTIKTV